MFTTLSIPPALQPELESITQSFEDFYNMVSTMYQLEPTPALEVADHLHKALHAAQLAVVVRRLHRATSAGMVASTPAEVLATPGARFDPNPTADHPFNIAAKTVMGPAASVPPGPPEQLVKLQYFWRGLLPGPGGEAHWYDLHLDQVTAEFAQELHNLLLGPVGHWYSYSNIWAEFRKDLGEQAASWSWDSASTAEGFHAGHIPEAMLIRLVLAEVRRHFDRRLTQANLPAAARIYR